MKSILRYIGVFLFILLAFHAQAQVTLTTNLTVSNTEALTGNPFFYTIDFGIASASEPGKNVVITDTLPQYIDFKNLVASNFVSSASYDPSSRVLTIKLITPLPAGTTGSIQMNCVFTTLLTPDKLLANNKIYIAASNAAISPVVSNTAMITSKATPGYFINKEFKSYNALNKTIIWKTYISYPGSSNCDFTGLTGITNQYVTDTLPAGAVFVSATNGGMETAPGSGIVVWDYTSRPFKYCNGGVSSLYSEVAVKYPTTPYGNNVYNTTTFKGVLSGNVPFQTTSFVAQYKLSPPAANVDCKTTNAYNYFYTYLRGIGDSTSAINVPFMNSGNVPFDSMNIEVPIPVETEVRGFIEADTSLHPVFYYSTNIAPATKIAVPLIYSNYYHGWKMPAFPTGIYISKLYISYKSVPPNFASSFAVPITILKKDRNGNNVTATKPFYPQSPCDGIGTCIPFQLKINYSIGATTTQSVCTIENMPKGLSPDVVFIDKGITNPKNFVPGDTVNFQLYINNNGDGFVNMKWADTLASQFDYVLNSWSAKAFDAATGQKGSILSPIFTKNGQILTFDFSSTPLAFSSVVVLYKVIIKKDTPSGIYTNKFYGTADNYKTWSGQRAVIVNEVNGVTAEKGVKGEVDKGYLFYPKTATTINGSEVAYKLRVNNLGNTKLKDLVLVDPLPYKGDDRGSEFTPYMTTLPKANQPNIIIYYALDSNICIYEISPAITPAGCKIPQWAAIPPANLKKIKAIKVVMQDTLRGGDSLSVTWNMTAPKDLKVNQVAYNNFHYQARKAATGTLLLTTSPNKVGVIISALGQIGEYVWMDDNKNGIRDENPSAGLNGIAIQLWQPGPDGIRNTPDDIFKDQTITANTTSGEPGYYKFITLSDNYFLKFKADSCKYHSTTINFTTNVFVLAPTELKSDMNLGLVKDTISISGGTSNCMGAGISYVSNLASAFASPVYQWQKSFDKGLTWNNMIATLPNLDFASVAETDSGTYRVLAAETGNINTACRIASNTIRLQIFNPMPKPAYTVSAVCTGTTATLNKLTPAATGTYYWYKSATGGIPLVNNFATPPLTADASYYLIDSIPGACKSVRSLVEIKVISKPAKPAYANISVCTGESATLNKTTPAATGTYFWYDKLTGGIPFPNNFTTPSLIAHTNYYLVDSIQGNCTSDRTAVNISVISKPANPVYTTVTVCPGEKAMLNKTAPLASGAYYWYNAATGGIPIANNFTTPALAANTSYYLLDSISGACISDRTLVEIQLGTVPANPILSGLSACEGESVKLNIITPAATGTYYWYDRASGGIPIANNFTTNPLTASVIYYLIDSIPGACKSARVAVPINMISKPINPAYPNVSVCTGESASLNKTTPAAAGAYFWYDKSIGGTPFLHSFSTPVLTANTNYYLIDSIPGSCRSERIPVLVTIISKPANPAYALDSVCTGTSAVLNKIAPKAAGAYFWYVTANGGNPIDNNFTTPLLSVPVSYYLIDSISGNCKSARAPVHILLKKCPEESGEPQIFFPTGFSPDNDGVNDSYTVFNVPEGMQVHVAFYNRWGDLVFKDENYHNTWNGTCEASLCLGEKLPSGTYFLVASLSNGNKYKLHVTLIRS